MRRTKEEAEATRCRIMQAALGLFSEQGITATSLVDIARRAGVTRGAIYWHFKDKWQLFEALRSHFSAPLDRLIAAGHDEQENDPLGKMAELLRYIFINVVENPQFRQILTMFLREQSHCTGGIECEYIQHFMVQINQKRQAMLSNAIRKGQLPQDLDIEAGAQLIRSTVEGVVFNWLQNPDSFDLAGRADQLVDSILAMLRHGAKLPDPARTSTT